MASDQQINLIPAELLDDAPKPRTVPNKFPTISSTAKLAIVGEAPGKYEVEAGEPFVGPSGRLLDGLLSRNNILRSSCFVGNVCQHQPPKNDIEEFEWSGSEIQAGLTQLALDLAMFKPNLVMVLGGTALRAACLDQRSIMNWRGSLFMSQWGYKALAAYHPAFCLRSEDGVPLLNLDIKRASTERMSPELVLPQRSFDLELSSAEIIDRLAQMQASGLEVSVDIEGTLAGIPCISFTTDPLGGIIVPFEREQGRNQWATDEEEGRVWWAVKQILEDPNCPKVLQNQLYDGFVLAYGHGILIRGVRHDTMLAHWEKYCELKKSLGLQASIYTKEPYYKGDRHAQDLKTFREYCCKDSAVTLEIAQRLYPSLKGGERASYHFGVDMEQPLLYMELTGMRFDVAKRDEKVNSLGVNIDILGAQIEAIAGAPLNVKSPKQKKEFLYGKLGLPEQFKRGTGAVTTNYEAILGLYKKTGHEVLGLIIEQTSLRTRQSALKMGVDPDGRVRCGYNALSKKEGKEDSGGPTSTGRLACSTSITGSGTNLQTIPEYDRDLFLADHGYEMFQCDLSGADSWTVAAHCARLGDRNMLLDLYSGIKVARVLALAVKHGANIISLDRDSLKQRCTEIAKDDPLYFAAKCCVHGSNYGMGKVLMSQTIFIQSEGKVNIPAATCEKLQQLYFRRYPGVLAWQRWVASELRNKRQLVHPSGHIRRFFGNPTEHSTLKAALADEPQGMTTYATNTAALRLWKDPENKNLDGSLIVQNLHQVHDALLGQWPIAVREWAKKKVRNWFENTFIIAGQSIMIPFDGHYGANWKEAGDEKSPSI